MHSEKWARGRRPLLGGLSVGALALGLGLVWWASINMGAQPSTLVGVHQGPASSETTPGADQTGSLDSDATTTPADAQSDAPGTDDVSYAKNPAIGDTVGRLTIPALKQTLPIIEGTDDDQLKRGVGHFSRSVFPGADDNCVLSGHRDTVFRDLGKLKRGDRLIVETAAGTFTYEIVRIRIVDKDDKTVIVPADHGVLTVTTCYPFNYVGSAPDRYVLIADLMSGR